MADAIQVFENAEYPSGLSAATAWLGIYQTLLWYEPVHWLEFDDLPHIIKQPDYEGLQRQNTLGIAFVGLIKHVLDEC